MPESNNTTFTSLYQVKTLDQIPTCVLRFLVVLGPFLHQLAKLCQIITWQHSNSRYSVLLVLIWISVCLFTWQLLALLPSLIVISLARDWFTQRTNKTRREQLEKKRQLEREKTLNDDSDDDDDDDRAKQLWLQQHQEEEDELLISRKIIPDNQVLLDNTLQDIAVINDCIQYYQQQCKPVFQAVDGTNRAQSISVLSVLMYAWPLWALVCWMYGAHVVFCMVGTVFLTSASPQCHLMVRTMKQNRVIKYILTSLWAYGVALITCTFAMIPTKRFNVKAWISLFRQRAKEEKSQALKILETQATMQQGRSEMIFQFELYENQRWWLGVNWTANMMPNEREAWTDAQLNPISSKDSFHLPEPTVKTIKYTKDGKQMEKTVNKVWSWADGDWWVDMTGEVSGKVDRHGWEYGNNAWKQLGGTPGMHTFTRRRRWCRRAKLVERETV